MKIGDLFGECSQLASIKVTCTSMYSSLSSFDENKIKDLISKNARFIVFIGGLGNDVIQFRERSELLAKMVSHRVLRAVNSRVLIVNNGVITEVNRDNLSKYYGIIAPKNPVVRDDRILIPRKEKTVFDEAMPERMPKKPARRGFQRTYRANYIMNKITNPIIIK